MIVDVSCVPEGVGICAGVEAERDGRRVEVDLQISRIVPNRRVDVGPVEIDAIERGGAAAGDFHAGAVGGEVPVAGQRGCAGDFDACGRRVVDRVADDLRRRAGADQNTRRAAGDRVARARPADRGGNGLALDGLQLNARLEARNSVARQSIVCRSYRRRLTNHLKSIVVGHQDAGSIPARVGAAAARIDRVADHLNVLGVVVEENHAHVVARGGDLVPLDGDSADGEFDDDPGRPAHAAGHVDVVRVAGQGAADQAAVAKGRQIQARVRTGDRVVLDGDDRSIRSVTISPRRIRR